MSKTKLELTDLSPVEIYSPKNEKGITVKKRLAERMINHSKGDWEVKKNSPYTFSKKDGITTQSGTGTNSTASE